VLSSSQDDRKLLKGSARSGGRLNIVDLLKGHEELLVRYGGHAAAAGFAIREENEDLLRENLSSDMKKRLDAEPDLISEKIEAELEIDLIDITQELANALTILEPFGKGNLKPLLSLRVPASSISRIRFLGQDGKHIKFSAGGLTCMYFRGADTVFPETGTVEILGFPEMNTWNGRSVVQFAVLHVKI
jgi:single-stranded-DNA-specific exonuclease